MNQEQQRPQGGGGGAVSFLGLAAWEHFYDVTAEQDVIGVESSGSKKSSLPS